MRFDVLAPQVPVKVEHSFSFILSPHHDLTCNAIASATTPFCYGSGNSTVSFLFCVRFGAMSAQHRCVRVGVPAPAGVRRPVSDARGACYLLLAVEGLKTDIIIPEHVLTHSTITFLFPIFLSTSTPKCHTRAIIMSRRRDYTRYHTVSGRCDLIDR